MLGIGVGIGVGLTKPAAGGGSGVPENGELLDDTTDDFELIDDNGDIMLLEG